MFLIYEGNVEGVPKVRSSNFMRNNLYFYMKFLKDVYCSIEYIIVFRSSVSCMSPFFFSSHSVAVAAWSGMSHIVASRAPDEPLLSLLAFLSPGMREPLRTPNNIIFFRLGSRK